MPLSMQIWNTYRNRAIGYRMNKNWDPIIPNFSWGDEGRYEFCFYGIGKHSKKKAQQILFGTSREQATGKD